MQNESCLDVATLLEIHHYLVAKYISKRFNKFKTFSKENKVGIVFPSFFTLAKCTSFEQK